MANERLEFPQGVAGVALNLEENEIGAVILGDPADVEEGDPVKLTGEILSEPVGDALLGRVVDVLGNPLDGGPPLDESKIAGQRPLEIQAPSVVQRQPVKEPLYFGIMAVDSMTAVGRGQRELIIGDMKTGKTAIGIDAIINQKRFWGTDRQVKCIYVAVGQKDSTVAQVVQALKDAGAMEYTVVVVAGGSRPAPFKYLEAFAAFGSELDKASQRQLERGARLVELLKQPQFSPVPVEDQVIAIYAGTNGYLDEVPADDVKRFERELLDYVHSRHGDTPKRIVETGQLSEEDTATLKGAIEE